MAAKRRGYIVAFEGPENIVSTQFDLLPDSSSILKIGSMRHRLSEHKTRLARHRSSGHVGRFVFGVDNMMKFRFKKAEDFIAAAAPGETRLVFLQGGAVGASWACADAVKTHVPSAEGNITRAQAYLTNIIRDGVRGLDQQQQIHAESENPIIRAMRAAEELDDRTASLQPESTYQFPRHISAFEGRIAEEDAESQHTATADDNTLAVPISRFSSWSSPSLSHSSGHISTAQEISFQRARIVPVALSSPGHLAPKEGETSDVSMGSDGRSKPPKAIREARRQEALMYLEGSKNPDSGYEPVLPLKEDLVFLLQEETSSISLDELAGAYSNGFFHVDATSQNFSPQAGDRFLELLSTNFESAVELQNQVRQELKIWLEKRGSPLDASIFQPLPDWSDLGEETIAALSAIEENTDLILAVGCQEGVDKASYESTVRKLARLGKPDGKTYSRTGRIDFRNLLHDLMEAHTSQPLAQQTDNPLANPSTTAEALLPHIAHYLASSTRANTYLLITFAQRHLPAVVALRDLIGRRRFKIAGILAANARTTEPPPTGTGAGEPSPLRRNPPPRISFSAADWTATSRTATAKLRLASKVWKALCAANEWYNPGAEDDSPSEPDNRRISIAVTTEGKSKAPSVQRPLSIAKRPEGYELGKSNYSRPLVPMSPPITAPASPDSPPAAASPPATAGSPLPPPPPPPPPPPRPSTSHHGHGHGHTHPGAPASPELTIRSSASGSSGSMKRWKDLAGASTGKLTRKLSALFTGAGTHKHHPAPSSPLAPPSLSHLPQAHHPHAPRLVQAVQAEEDALDTEPDEDDADDHEEDMDEEDKRILGRFASKRGRRNDGGRGEGKAAKMLGLR
ncbi:hypothetical protein GE09DRAFT_270093 [Coniochaeta sp. 2T2.1]|nr:hypothetical protein GE09DRAFT_270093 [Coniochaeta sp. 2T2.1]